MKRFLAILSLVSVLFCILCCDNDDQNFLDSNCDFSVLGLKELQINEFIFNLKPNGYPIGIATNDSVGLLGVSSGTSTNSFDLYITKTSSKSFKIDVYSNAEVNKEIIEEEKNQEYKIIVTKKDREETIIYNIKFSSIYNLAE